jgi:hypothetical protein
MVRVIVGREWRVGSRKSRIDSDICGRENIEMVHADGIDPKVIIIVIKHRDNGRGRIWVGGNGSRIRDGVVVRDSFDDWGDRGDCGR